MQTSPFHKDAGAAQMAESFVKTLLWSSWKRMVVERGVPTLRYLTRTDAHTFAFSVAANAILSFFPFMVLIIWLIKNVFHSPGMQNVVFQLLRDHLPAGQEFVVRNLDVLVKARQRVKWASIVILLITSTGVFLPLEVAFNQIWGFTKNRSYLGNQIVSLFLAFSCGVLAMASVGVAAGNQWMLQVITFGSKNFVFSTVASIALKILATVASIAIFFLIYWILPHGKVKALDVMPAAVAMGILWELARWVYIKTLPWLNFQEVYGPFTISVTLMFWAFLSGLMVLAGAYLASDGPTGPPGRGKLEHDAADEIEFT